MASNTTASTGFDGTTPENQALMFSNGKAQPVHVPQAFLNLRPDYLLRAMMRFDQLNGILMAAMMINTIPFADQLAEDSWDMMHALKRVSCLRPSLCITSVDPAQASKAYPKALPGFQKLPTEVIAMILEEVFSMDNETCRAMTARRTYVHHIPFKVYCTTPLQHRLLQHRLACRILALINPRKAILQVCRPFYDIGIRLYLENHTIVTLFTQYGRIFQTRFFGEDVTNIQPDIICWPVAPTDLSRLPEGYPSQLIKKFHHFGVLARIEYSLTYRVGRPIDIIPILEHINIIIDTKYDPQGEHGLALCNAITAAPKLQMRHAAVHVFVDHGTSIGHLLPIYRALELLKVIDWVTVDVQIRCPLNFASASDLRIAPSIAMELEAVAKSWPAEDLQVLAAKDVFLEAREIPGQHRDEGFTVFREVMEEDIDRYDPFRVGGLFRSEVAAWRAAGLREIFGPDADV